MELKKIKYIQLLFNMSSLFQKLLRERFDHVTHPVWWKYVIKNCSRNKLT